MPAGRPRKIKSPEDMQAIADEYFRQCEVDEKPFTITGVALALGLCSRNELSDYGEREEFSRTVKGIKARCENYAENRLYANNPTGAIFALKNYGWTDKTEQIHSGELTVIKRVVSDI